MTEKTLLASVVLFRELYDKEKDVYDVISEFIKAALVFSQTFTVNATTARQLLTQEFGLDIPEAVVNTTIRNRLYKRDEVLSLSEGQYTVEMTRLAASQPLIESLKRLIAQQNGLFSDLVAYVEGRRGHLSEERKEALIDRFGSYLGEGNTTSPNSEEISSFIISSQSRPGFREQLDAVREGFVLYEGVRHAPDLDQLNSWKHKLVVYLDTEHLFSAAGLNGALHEQLFKDFHNLVSDVIDKGRKLISLRYFSECEDEVDRFFHAAEHIIEGKGYLDPSKPAMAKIIEGCQTRSDVVAKRAQFFSKLDKLGIHEAEIPPGSLAPRFNLESTDLIREIKKDIESRGRSFVEEKCADTLRMFTKINSLRNGSNSGAFEAIGHVLVSGSFIANFLAYHPLIRAQSADVPFATDLEFITNRLWFKLRKGLAKNLPKPQSLSVLAKAQVVLSSQINSSISEKFDRITADYSSGKIDRSDAQYLFNELRDRASTPEAITPEKIASMLEFLDHKDYENHLRERSLLVEQAKRGQEAENELARIRREGKQKRERQIRRISLVLHVAVISIAIGTYVYFLFLFLRLAGPQDSRFSVATGMVGVALATLPLFKLRTISAWVKNSHSAFVQRYSSNQRN